MFKKHKEEQAQKVQEWLDLQDATIAKIEEEFTKIEALTDASEKIVSLYALESSLFNRQDAADSSANEIVHAKENRKAWKVFGGSTAGTAAAIAVPAVILAPSLLGLLPFALIGGLFGSLFVKEELSPEQQEKLDAFDTRMQGFATRAEDMVKETARTADLTAVAKSPFFAEAFSSCKPLSERFAAAAAAKAALEDASSPAAVTPVVAEEKPPAAPREKRQLSDWTKYKS